MLRAAYVCLLLLLAMLASRGWAATADLTRHRPPATPGGALRTQGTGALYPGQWSTAVSIDYANNPLTWRYPDNSYQPVIRHQMRVALAAAIGIYRLVDLGVSLPLIVLQDGAHNAGFGAISGASVGDLRLIPRAQILPERSTGVGVAVTSELTLPTGAEQRFVGEPTVSWRPRLLASTSFGNQLRLRASTGPNLRRSTAFAGLQVASEWALRAAALVDFALAGRTTTAIVELDASTSLQQPFTGGLSAAEALAAVRARLGRGIAVTLGAGTGLSRGVGVPTVRTVMAIRYTPESSDRDGDGMPDGADACPETPEDFDMFADLDGCADPDNDRDDIPDIRDACPQRPEDLDQNADADGCPDSGVEPADRDNDSVPDSDDECPSTPEDRDGHVDTDGCPDPDNDVDGVLDPDDQCPTQKETINGRHDSDGCPDVGKGATEYVQDVKIEIKETIHFEVGSAILKPRSESILDQVALQILAHPEIEMIRIEGHTDSRGEARANLYLSQERADAVRRYLIGRGVPKEMLQAIGHGESHPIAPNATAAGRQRNRRVEFYITTR